MKFLIAGFGSAGRRHMRNLLALGEKDIVLYRTRQSTLPDDELKGFIVETDLRKALDHCPDAVIIANPTAYHLDVAIPAAEQGCHLLIEKPVSHNMERIDVLQATIERSKSRVLVGFQYRFHPGLKKVKEILVGEEIGRPISLRSQYCEYLPGWHPWEDYRHSYSARSDLGGGVAITLTHPLDYVRWLMGDAEILWSKGLKISDLEIDVEDYAEFGLKFANGVVGSVILNYYQQPTVNQLEIICTRGTLRWDNADGSVHVFSAQNNQWSVYPLPEGFERNMLFMDEMAHFIRVVKGEVESSCTLDDGIKALELALTARK
jgi:predicted dehydrogenase